MATLEKKRLVLRVAYAGPPLAGKTESIRALLRLLRGKGGDRYVFSPGEARGRTVFFDWADYEAGTFQGNPIRCQITSVPGQAVLGSRRKALLQAADAVILVVDSRPEGLEEAQKCYAEMAPWLAEAGREVAIRVILQCNKQDLEGSIPAQTLTAKLGLPIGSRAHATSARTGKGLRPAFIAAVREALERAQTLIDRDLIKFGQPEINSGQELLEKLQREVFDADTKAEAELPAPPTITPVLVAPASPAPEASPIAPPAPLAPPTPPALASPAPLALASPAPPALAPPAPLAPSTPPPPPPVRVTPPAVVMIRAISDPRTSALRAAELKGQRPAVMPVTAWRGPTRKVQPDLGLLAAVATSVSVATPKLEPVLVRAPVPIPVVLAAPPPVAHLIERRRLPESAARPAVMPASAYRPASPTPAPNGASHTMAPQIAAATAHTMAPQIAAATARKVPETPATTAATTWEPGTAKPRPAVMPAAAFRARLANATTATAPSSIMPPDEPSNVEQKGPTLADWPHPGDSPEAMAETLIASAAGFLDAMKMIDQAPEAFPVDHDSALEEALRQRLSMAPRPPMDVPAVLTELHRQATGRLPGSLLEMMCSVLIGH